MAQRKPKTVKKVVNVMTNPNPEFVSLVGHPANQSPFKAVKLDPTAIDRLAQAEASAELAQRTQVEPVEVQKFMFDKNSFKSEETVRSYLDSRNWTDYSIKDVGKYFEVPNMDEDQFDGELETISAQTGITMTVGKVKKSAATATPEPRIEVKPGTTAENPTPDTKSENLVKRYDAWYAAWSNGTTMKDVMVDGYDGLPPGFWEVADAYFTALRNNLIAKDENAVRSLSSEWTEIVLRLVSVFKDLTPEEVQRMSTKSTKSETANTKPAEASDTSKNPPQAVEPSANAGDAPENGNSAATTPETSSTADTPNTENQGKNDKGKPQEDLAETVAKAVRGALGTSITDALKPFTEKIDASTNETKSLKEEMTKLSGRLDTVETAQRQTRQSASIEDVKAPGTTQTPIVDPEKAKRAEARERRERAGILGIG